MAYRKGEHPEVRDYVRDRNNRRGIVTHVMMWGSGRCELVVEWEDGTIGIRYTAHEDFELLRRQGEEIVLPSR